jgi:hypothetical protein
VQRAADATNKPTNKQTNKQPAQAIELDWHLGYSPGTHRVLTGYSPGTHRVLNGYSPGTHRVLTGYSTGSYWQLVAQECVVTRALVRRHNPAEPCFMRMVALVPLRTPVRQCECGVELPDGPVPLTRPSRP